MGKFNVWNEKDTERLIINITFKSEIFGKTQVINFNKTYSKDDIVNGDDNWIKDQLVEVKVFLNENASKKREYLKIINHYIGSFHDFKRTHLDSIEKPKIKYIR